MASFETTFQTFASEAPGDVAWTDPANARLSDDSYATVSLGSGDDSEYLVCRDILGVAANVPLSSVFRGLEVDIEHHRAGLGSGTFSFCKFYRNGKVFGDDKADDSNVGTSDATKTVGGATDGWGAGISMAQLRNALSGVAIAYSHGSGGAQTMRVDQVKLTIHHEPGGTPSVHLATGVL